MKSLRYFGSNFGKPPQQPKWPKKQWQGGGWGWNNLPYYNYPLTPINIIPEYDVPSRYPSPCLIDGQNQFIKGLVMGLFGGILLKTIV